jgi:heme o synthase
VAAERAASILDVTRAPLRSRNASGLAAISDRWALTKPEVNFLILLTTFAGFYLASPPGQLPILPVIRTLLGTLLVASGAGALNQFFERSFDAQMKRTARRPLASGRVKPMDVLWFGVSLSLVGAVYLALGVNVLSASLAVATLLSYLLLYTPLKRKTPLCTLVGAFPGAAPPLIGWAAARGHLDPMAWVLYALVFLWQFPHFMAIAWMYREDYSRAGYLVLPSGDSRNSFVSWQTLGVSLVLIPVSLIPALTRHPGLAYLAGGVVMGSIFCYYGASFAIRKSNLAARKLLAASIIYLPAIWILMMLDRT